MRTSHFLWDGSQQRDFSIMYTMQADYSLITACARACMCILSFPLNSNFFFHLVLRIFVFLVVFHFCKQKRRRMCLPICSENSFQFGFSIRGLICFLCAILAWSRWHILLDFNSYASMWTHFEISTWQVNCLSCSEPKFCHSLSRTSWHPKCVMRMFSLLVLSFSLLNQRTVFNFNHVHNAKYLICKKINARNEVQVRKTTKTWSE